MKEADLFACCITYRDLVSGRSDAAFKPVITMLSAKIFFLFLSENARIHNASVAAICSLSSPEKTR